MSVWHKVGKSRSVWENAYAQAVVTDEEFERARQLPLTQIKDMAKRQIARAKELWSESSKLTWTGEALLPSYLHWKPFKDVIDNADMNFSKAEQEPEEDRQKILYLLSWKTARIAVDSISKEVQADRSYYEILAEPYLTPIKNTYNEAKNQIKETSDTVVKIALALAVLFVVLEATKK